MVSLSLFLKIIILHNQHLVFGFQVPSRLQQLFVSWKESKSHTKTSLPCCSHVSTYQSTRKSSIGFERTFNQCLTLRAHHQVNKYITRSSLGNSYKHKASANLQRNMGEQKADSLTWPCIRPNEELSILSLHIPIQIVVSQNQPRCLI